MGGKEQIAATEKLKYAQLCANGQMTQAEASRLLCVSDSVVNEWVRKYEHQGAEGFAREGRKEKHYSIELKLEVVKAYNSGEGSYASIAAKYGIRSRKQVYEWVKMYNSGITDLKGRYRMNTNRKTTFEERLKIVKDCLNSGSSYQDIARKYDVSYNQVYRWMKKYSELGEAGLEDRRGRRKVDQEPRSEVEELKIKMAQLEHELYMTKMERDLLKKVKELERKELYRK